MYIETWHANIWFKTWLMANTSNLVTTVFQYVSLGYTLLVENEIEKSLYEFSDNRKFNYFCNCISLCKRNSCIFLSKVLYIWLVSYKTNWHNHIMIMVLCITLQHVLWNQCISVLVHIIIDRIAILTNVSTFYWFIYSLLYLVLR